jgi:hypothetical protein
VLGQHGNMEVISSPNGDKITMHRYRAQTSAECIIVIIAGLMVRRGLGSSLD